MLPFAVSAQFQKIYGTSGDNYFSKVIPDGSNFYVLGSGNGGGGSISRVNSTGQIQWTRSITSGSVLNDAVLTGSGGSLFFVGGTQPNNASSKGIAGVITPTGNFPPRRFPKRNFFSPIIFPLPQNFRKV